MKGKCLQVLVGFTLLGYTSNAQVVEPPPMDEEIVEENRTTPYHIWEVENAPQYPGGDSAWNAYLKFFLIYPTEAREAEIEGAVILEFDIDTSGNVSNIKVLKSVGFGCDKEAIRLLKGTEWTPGSSGGRLVPVRVRIPIRFTLGDG